MRALAAARDARLTKDALRILLVSYDHGRPTGDALARGIRLQRKAMTNAIRQLVELGHLTEVDAARLEGGGQAD